MYYETLALSVAAARGRQRVLESFPTQLQRVEFGLRVPGLGFRV